GCPLTVTPNSTPASQRTLELPAAGPHVWADGGWIVRRAAASLGYLSLVAIVGTNLVLVLAAAERHSFLSPPSHAGFPHWMSGPLTGLLPGLTHHGHPIKVDFTIAVAGAFALYRVVLASMRFLRAWPVLAAFAA